jgi:hypothetical protein
MDSLPNAVDGSGLDRAPRLLVEHLPSLSNFPVLSYPARHRISLSGEDSPLRGDEWQS